jgi:hypothetical protein
MTRREYFKIADKYSDDLKAKAERGIISVEKTDRLIGKLNEWLDNLKK